MWPFCWFICLQLICQSWSVWRIHIFFDVLNLTFLSLLARKLRFIFDGSRKLKSSVHYAIFKFLSNFLLKLFKFFLNFRIYVSRPLQVTTRQADCVPTRRTRSFSYHSISYLAEMWFTINVLRYHRLRWHFILMVVVFFRWH